MGFDGFQVIEFAVWLRIYVVFYRFWWLRSDGICDLDVNLRGTLWLLMASRRWILVPSWPLPHERPKKGSRTPFLIFRTRFPGGLPEVDFRAFSVSSRLGAHEYVTIRRSGRFGAQKYDKMRRSGSLGAQKYDKIRRSGRLWAQKYDILMAWEWLNLRFDCKFTW